MAVAEFNLDLEPMDYYVRTSPTSEYSKHHMSASCFQYGEANGNILLFLDMFNSVPDTVDNEIRHMVKESEVNRLDNIAWQYYKNPELMWVIMAVNNIINPFEVEYGRILRILPKDYIEYYLRYGRVE